jgi:phage-related tail protein
MNPPPPANNAPSVSMIANQTSDQDVAVAVDFTVDDRESGAGGLTVTAMADGTGLYPADGVMLTGSGATRTLTLTPLEATTGSANITVSVADPEGLATTRSFAVSVNAKNTSIREKVFESFAKGESDSAVAMNGWTAQQDADDPATFAGLIPEGEE